MLPNLRIFVAIAGALVFVGCESGAPAPGVDHDADYALDIKAKTFEFAEEWQRKPADAKGLLDGLTEQLAAYETLPVGEHLDTYKSLRDAAQKLQENYPQATAEQVRELKAIAENLPGDPSTVAYE